MGYAGLGGFVSELLMARQGVTGGSLVIGTTTAGPLIVATGPRVTTGVVTGSAIVAGGTTATLHGTVTSLNGSPRGLVWFEWGQAPGALINSTAVTPVVATGEVTATITGYNPGDPVYYRFAGNTDGTVYGATGTFTIGTSSGGTAGGAGGGYFILWNVLPIAIVAAIAIATFKSGASWETILAIAIGGLLAIAVLQAVLRSLW